MLDKILCKLGFHTYGSWVSTKGRSSIHFNNIQHRQCTHCQSPQWRTKLSGGGWSKD
jgi:hypothetical protein